MDEISFWKEPSGKRLIGCLGVTVFILVVFSLICAAAYYDNKPKPKKAGNYWLNHDSSRPLSDVGSYDYERRLIIYRDEKPQRPLKEFRWEQDPSYYKDPTNYYEDYYEEMYEYFHD